MDMPASAVSASSALGGWLGWGSSDSSRCEAKHRPTYDLVVPPEVDDVGRYLTASLPVKMKDGNRLTAYL